TPIVGHAYEAVGLHFHLDEAGMPGERLVHGVVDHLGKQMVERLFVGAADIHPWTAAYGLEAFEHLDVAGGITGLRSASDPASAPPLARQPPRSGLEQITEQVFARILRGAFGCYFGGLRHASHDR